MRKSPCKSSHENTRKRNICPPPKTNKKRVVHTAVPQVGQRPLKSAAPARSGRDQNDVNTSLTPRTPQSGRLRLHPRHPQEEKNRGAVEQAPTVPVATPPVRAQRREKGAGCSHVKSNSERRYIATDTEITKVDVRVATRPLARDKSVGCP